MFFLVSHYHFQEKLTARICYPHWKTKTPPTVINSVRLFVTIDLEKLNIKVNFR